LGQGEGSPHGRPPILDFIRHCLCCEQWILLLLTAIRGRGRHQLAAPVCLKGRCIRQSNNISHVSLLALSDGGK